MSNDNNNVTKKLTMSNNILTTLTTNNNNVSIDCAEAQSTNDLDASRESLRSSFEEKRLQVVEGGSSATRQCEDLPKNWDWIKVDLFDNSKNYQARHKLAVSICKDKQIRRFRSLNNSPFALFKRGIVNYQQDPHYVAVRDLYHSLKSEELLPQVSKCYRAGYRGKTPSLVGLSTILVRHSIERRYSAAIVAEVSGKQQVIWVPLSGEAGRLSEAQRRKNIIATGGIYASASPYGSIRLGDVL